MPLAVPGFPLAWLVVFALVCLQPARAATASTTGLAITSSGASVTSVPAGTVISLIATVASSTTPTAPVTPGLVRFCDASATRCEDSALLGTAQLTASGTATIRFVPGLGTHTYQAKFVGTLTFSASTSTQVSVDVTGQYATTTAIASSGQVGNYTLTATVAGIGTRTISPQGTVSFLDITNGSASLGTATLGAGYPGENLVLGPVLDYLEPGAMVTGDFNGDGLLDLATVDRSGAILFAQLGNGDGTFTTAPGIQLPAASYSLAAGDFNSDGILDLIAAGGGQAIVLLGVGDGTFVIKSSVSIGVGYTPGAAVGDFNGDGVPDLVVADGTSESVFLGNGDGTFTLKSSIPAVGVPSNIATADFNGDGVLDLATGFTYGWITVLMGNGDGTFTSGLTPPGSAAPIASGDFNGDGIPDLASCEVGSATVTVLLGNGDGTFTVKSSPAVGTAPDSIVAGDVNGDGITDIVTVNLGSLGTVLLGNGDGTFVDPPALAFGAPGVSIVAGDFNGDGVIDLATINNSNALNIVLNQLTRTATATLQGANVSGNETHLVEASYPGDADFLPSTSTTVTLLAALIPTTLSLSSTAVLPAMLTANLSPFSSGVLTTDGEVITFYNGGVSIGSAVMLSGVATLHVSTLPTGTNTLTAAYPGDGSFAAAMSNPISQAFAAPAHFLVTVTTDSTTGLASNCAATAPANCSLRDALAAASAAGGGIVSFDPNVFSTAQTVTLGAAGALNIPSNTTITGPTTGSGANPTYLVTIDAGRRSGVFNVSQGAVNAVITGLAITDGGESLNVGGGGIYNAGGLTISTSSVVNNICMGLAGGGIYNEMGAKLTITGSSIANNSAWIPSAFAGGIYNNGTLVLIGSAVTSNGMRYGDGGGIYNDAGGTLLMINDTVAGNYQHDSGFGGGIGNAGTLTLIGDTITGNTVPDLGSGAGIENHGTMSVTNSLVGGNVDTNYFDNTFAYPFPVEDDCVGTNCPVNGAAGNIVSPSASSIIPLPGSPAICAGLLSNIPRGITTDQLGASRVSSYGGTTCVDSGAIQSHYSLIFSVEPPTNIPVAAAFAAAVQLLESGSPFPLGGLTIPLSLRASNGLLNLNSLTTDATGLAASSLLQVSAAGTGDTLVANLPLTASGGLPSVGLAASSSSFNVGSPTGCDDDRDHSRRHDHDDHDRGRCRCNSEEDRRHSRDMRKKCEPGD